MARTGLLDHLQASEGYQATMRVMDTMGLGAIEFDNMTARPTEEQFWHQFDGVYELNEAEMKRELPNIVTDPSNLEKVNALLAGTADAAIKAPEVTRQLAWNVSDSWCVFILIRLIEYATTDWRPNIIEQWAHTLLHLCTMKATFLRKIRQKFIQVYN